MGESNKINTATPSLPPPLEARCLSEPEWRLFQRLNEDRQKFADEYIQTGRNQKRALPLQVDCDLARSARAYSKDMAERHFFGHINPEGVGHILRIVKFTTRYAIYGMSENVACGGHILRFKDTDLFEVGFMASKEHRNNILDPDMTHAGIGVFVAEDGEVFVTQQFGSLPKK